MSALTLAFAATVLSLIGPAAARADGLAPGDLLVHPAIRHGELALYPVSFRTPRAPAWDFILLDEGLADGSVRIRETAAPAEAADTGGGRAPEARAQGGPQTEAQAPARASARPQVEQVQAQQVQQMVSGDGAQVNRLSVQNASARPLLLLAGEMVKGAKQDRIIAHDVVIAAGTRIDDLDVFCVESGRWTAQSAEFSSAKAVSGAAVRATAQLEKSQAAVWSTVSGYNAAVGASSATESLNAAYEKPDVKVRIEAAQRRLDTLLESVPDPCGVLVAIGGRFVVADLFGSADLFRRLRDKLLAGYLIDTVAATPVEADPPGIDEARRYLAAMLEAPRSPDWRGGELLVERFQAAGVRGARSSWRGSDLHVNGY